MPKLYLYIVRGRDHSLYTGITKDISIRIEQHNSGNKGAKSLRGRVPVDLVYSEVYNSKGEALKREIEIKSWSKGKKESLNAGVAQW